MCRLRLFRDALWPLLVLTRVSSGSRKRRVPGKGMRLGPFTTSPTIPPMTDFAPETRSTLERVCSPFHLDFGDTVVAK